PATEEDSSKSSESSDADCLVFGSHGMVTTKLKSAAAAIAVRLVALIGHSEWRVATSGANGNSATDPSRGCGESVPSAGGGRHSHRRLSRSWHKRVRRS